MILAVVNKQRNVVLSGHSGGGTNRCGEGGPAVAELADAAIPKLAIP